MTKIPHRERKYNYLLSLLEDIVIWIIEKVGITHFDLDHICPEGICKHLKNFCHSLLNLRPMLNSHNCGSGGYGYTGRGGGYSIEVAKNWEGILIDNPQLSNIVNCWFDVPFDQITEALDELKLIYRSKYLTEPWNELGYDISQIVRRYHDRKGSVLL